MPIVDPTRSAFELTRRAFAMGSMLLLAPRPGWAQSGASGKTLNFLVDPEPTMLVALTSTAAGNILVTAKVTEGLFDYDNDFSLRPQLATAMTTSPDGLRVTFKLRQGVRWHDGQPFTAQDVAHSIYLLKTAHPRGRATLANVVEVQTPDELTAVLVLSAPAPYLRVALAGQESPIVPKHLYGAGEPAANPRNLAPVGTGPFLFKEWVRGSHIIYERNPSYWDPAKPKVDRILVRFVPDAASRSIAFETGEVDLGGDSPVPLSDVERLRASPRLSVTTDGYSYSPLVTKIEFNLDNEFFRNPLVRRAVAHALDRRFIINNIFYGHGKPATGPIHPSQTEFYTAEVPTYAFDPAAAERLLDEAGLRRGANGIRFRVSHDPMPLSWHPRTGEYVKQALSKVGIEVVLRAQDFPTFVKRIYTDRAFDFITSTSATTPDPTLGVQRLYWSKSFQPGVPFSNASHYSSPECDQALEAAQVEIDRAKRAAHFHRFQAVIARDLPSIDLVAVDTLTLYNKRLMDHSNTPGGVHGSLGDTYFSS